MESDLPDLTGLRIGCCPRNQKRAALLFDFVTTATMVLNEEEAEKIRTAPSGIIAHDGTILEKVKNDWSITERSYLYFGKNQFTLGELWEVHRDSLLIELARIYRNQGALAVVFDLLHPNLVSLDKYPTQNVGINATLSQIPVAIESELSWEQVSDFRSDEESQRKYRDLHLWLNYSLKAESEEHAAEIIEQKIEDYRWAISKHGIKTWNEIITSVLGLGSIVPTAGGIASVSAKLNPLLGVLTGTGLVIAGIYAWATKRNLELEDIKRGANREIAYIYDVQNLIK